MFLKTDKSGLYNLEMSKIEDSIDLSLKQS